MLSVMTDLASSQQPREGGQDRNDYPIDKRA